MNSYSYIHINPSAETQPACEVSIIHEEQVRLAQSSLLDEASAVGLAEAFQAMADPTRLKLISALMSGEMCVCDLAATLVMSQSAVSHQLKILRSLGIVRFRKEGRVVYYALDDDHIHQMYQLGLDHYQHRSRR
jgi:ArsR family transcriptional regulator, lead/cadmium/zinc/bismuth-responsive transcriptional repressor